MSAVVLGGWAGQVAGYPMNEHRPSCGSPGMNGPKTTGNWTVYCKPNHSLVGVADTMGYIYQWIKT